LDALSAEALLAEHGEFLAPLANCSEVETARGKLLELANDLEFKQPGEAPFLVRDAARALRSMLRPVAEERAGFSVANALWDLARRKPRPDLAAGFHAEMIHLLRALRGQAQIDFAASFDDSDQGLSGREASLARSSELDQLWTRVEATMGRYADGLSEAARARRAARRKAILAALGGGESDWSDWKWQTANVIKGAEALARCVKVAPDTLKAAGRARNGRLPFGVTPYYASLMDDDPEAGRDRSVRAQVLPPPDYVEEMLAHRSDRNSAFDFMREHDTSPVDLVTRRYPAIAILKPFNTCPQICVYCQRNWEIEEAMAPGALAPWEKIDAAIDWIAGRPALREVLVTGGDPLAMADADLARILKRLAAIEHVDLIRIGSRVPVTVPMRIDDALADLLGSLREPGRRETCLVTHVQHPYEITPEMVAAVERLRRRGIGLYNQMVYTFFASRRFEAARLRFLLRRIGIDPYYTFVPKGKEETRAYRVPLARLLQEQKEEARLLPGMRRTDEVVYNVPGLGKNYMRASQHRDLLAVAPDGKRVYEFHPWEKKIAPRNAYVGRDVPILDYLRHLEEVGEDARDYESIWYYY